MRPAMMLSSVDFPHPMKPTMVTNSPRSTDSVTFSSTGRTASSARNVFETNETSMNDTILGRGELRGGESHQTVEREADQPDRQDREHDVGVDEAVVFLPEEPADARCPREHFTRNDDPPRDAEAQAIPRDEIWERR